AVRPTQELRELVLSRFGSGRRFLAGESQNTCAACIRDNQRGRRYPCCSSVLAIGRASSIRPRLLRAIVLRTPNSATSVVLPLESITVSAVFHAFRAETVSFNRA